VRNATPSLLSTSRYWKLIFFLPDLVP